MAYQVREGEPVSYTIPRKKTLMLNILNILKKYSDENHRLSAKEIGERLEREYSQKVDRRAIKRNLINLIDCGYELRFTESTRKTQSGEDETITTNWYLVRDFEDSELRLLIDSLLFSKYISRKQCKDLIEKLEGLSNNYFKSKVTHISTMPENFSENKQIFYTIDILDEAISSKKEVSFKYFDYGIDKKLHYRCDENGKPKEYTVSPYQMAATNGRYYLIAYRAAYDELSNFRIDRINDIHMLDSPAMPLEKMPGFKYGLDLPRLMAEHVYMYTGESVHAVFEAKKYLVGDIIDWFGPDVNFQPIDTDTIRVSVTVNEQAMVYWALQYGMHIEVKSPQGLRDKIKKAVDEMAEKYREEKR
jgi:predicted DNA-binding transcriptional regulator YafY